MPPAHAPPAPGPAPQVAPGPGATEAIDEKPKFSLPPGCAAAMLAHLFPGAGQFYNKQWAKGSVFLVTFLVTAAYGTVCICTVLARFYTQVVNLANPQAPPPHLDFGRLIPGLVALFVAALVGVASTYDAWAVAKRREGAASEPVPEQPPVTTNPAGGSDAT